MKPELTIVPNAAMPPAAPGQANAQSEMPFAVVEGQPVTELPRAYGRRVRINVSWRS